MLLVGDRNMISATKYLLLFTLIYTILFQMLLTSPSASFETAPSDAVISQPVISTASIYLLVHK